MKGDRMHISIGFLTDIEMSNQQKRLGLMLHQTYGLNIEVLKLPAHVSLKQVFQSDNLLDIKKCVESFAKTIQPFEVTYDAVQWMKPRNGNILWFNVVETKTLRQLHNQLNAELLKRHVSKGHLDGDSYHFHTTLVMGDETEENYQQSFHVVQKEKFPIKSSIKAVAIFVSTEAQVVPGQFITYTVIPLGESRS